MKAFSAALLAALLLLVGACSGTSAGNTGDGSGPTHETTPRQESTRSSSSVVQESTGESSVPEATLGTGPKPPAVVLRIEGDPRTAFSGICSVGHGESVLSGRVPRRFTFDLDGEKLSCRVQKRDSSNGSLKVTLTANGTTRSVQQTDSRDGVINVSYEGG
jgi:hypothetical protein